MHEAGLRPQFDALSNLPIGVRPDFLRRRRSWPPFRLTASRCNRELCRSLAMLEMIVAEASKFPHFKLEREVTVRDLIYEKDRVVGVHADAHDGPREYRGDFTIACDGRASVIRKRAALPQDRIMQGFDVVWGHVPGQFPDGRTARGYIGNGHPLIMYPSPEGHTQIGWVIDKGTFGDIKRMGDRWIDQLAPHVSPDMRQYLAANKTSLARPVLLDVNLRLAGGMDRARPAPDWRRRSYDVPVGVKASTSPCATQSSRQTILAGRSRCAKTKPRSTSPRATSKPSDGPRSQQSRTCSKSARAYCYRIRSPAAS